jgi:hypothetical protein
MGANCRANGLILFLKINKLRTCNRFLCVWPFDPFSPPNHLNDFYENAYEIYGLCTYYSPHYIPFLTS